MDIKHRRFIAKCKNDSCNNTIKLSEGRFVGGCNDSGGVIIKCNTCQTIFACNLKNPIDASDVTSGGKVIDKWTDNFPKEFEDKYNVKEIDLSNVEKLLVFGFDKLPKIGWHYSETPTFGTDKINFEITASNALDSHTETLKEYYKSYCNYYLKGSIFAKKSIIIINYKYQDVKYKAVFAKEIDSEKDINEKNLYLIHHSKTNLVNQIDGIFTKSECLLFLERFLNRWKYCANEVLLVVPFIGYHYKNSLEALTELWNWLEVNILVEKTNLITRKGTFNLLKKAQDNSGIPYDLLVEWGLLEPLVDSMERGKMTFYQKSHAKYYVGVFGTYVEVLSGSFNIHSGPSFENLTFRRYPKEFFQKRYLHMFKKFSYSKKRADEKVHYINLGNGNEKNSSESILKLTDTIFKEDE